MSAICMIPLRINWKCMHHVRQFMFNLWGGVTSIYSAHTPETRTNLEEFISNTVLTTEGSSLAHASVGLVSLSNRSSGL